MLDQFLTYLVIERGCSENTLAAYENDLQAFLEDLDTYRVKKSPDIEAAGG